MTDIRLFVTDLDGTLLQHDHLTVSPRTRAALMALKRRGIRLCACTGRCRCMLPAAVRELGFDYAITSNGAACDDLRAGQRLFTTCLTAGQAAYAWDQMEHTDSMIEWFVDGELLLDRRNHNQWPERLRAPWHRVYLGAGRGTVVEDVREFFAQGAPGLEKINVMNFPAGAMDAPIAALRARGGYEISTSLGYNYEIGTAEANKGLGLARLCARLGLTLEQVIAFGDSENDEEMLEAAGLGVAMGNALDYVRQHANAVTLTNDEDGVASFLEQLGLAV